MSNQDMVRLVLHRPSHPSDQEIIYTVTCGDTVSVDLPVIIDGRTVTVRIASLEIIDLIRGRNEAP